MRLFCSVDFRQWTGTKYKLFQLSFFYLFWWLLTISRLPMWRDLTWHAWVSGRSYFWRHYSNNNHDHLFAWLSRRQTRFTAAINVCWQMTNAAGFISFTPGLWNTDKRQKWRRSKDRAMSALSVCTPLPQLPLLFWFHWFIVLGFFCFVFFTFQFLLL